MLETFTIMFEIQKVLEYKLGTFYLMTDIYTIRYENKVITKQIYWFFLGINLSKAM